MTHWKKAAALMLLLLSHMWHAAPAAAGGLSITVLYDNVTYQEDLTADWGFSCLIRLGRKNILFDAGKEGEILFANTKQLGIDLKKIHRIVISHLHQDHVGGLLSVLDIQPRVPVFLPELSQELSQQFQDRGVKTITVPKPMQIDNGVFLTGAMGQGMKEQGLIINTPLGLILVAGCSHPGIVNMIRHAKEMLNRPVLFVIGGFHTMPESPEGLSKVVSEFRQLGVKKVGPAHCTSEKTKAFFKAAYKNHYVTVGAGRTINISSKMKN